MNLAENLNNAPDTLLIFHLDGREESLIVYSGEYKTKIMHPILLFKLGLAEVQMLDGYGTLYKMIDYDGTHGVGWETMRYADE